MSRGVIIMKMVDKKKQKTEAVLCCVPVSLRWPGSFKVGIITSSSQGPLGRFGGVVPETSHVSLLKGHMCHCDSVRSRRSPN